MTRIFETNKHLRGAKDGVIQWARQFDSRTVCGLTMGSLRQEQRGEHCSNTQPEEPIGTEAVEGLLSLKLRQEVKLLITSPAVLMQGLELESTLKTHVKITVVSDATQATNDAAAQAQTNGHQNEQNLLL